MGIWTRSPHQQFTVKVGGPSIEGRQFASTWEAYSVLIANRTTQHLRLPDVNWWVPPGTVGQVMPVPALMQATARFEPPPGVIDPAPINGQIATLDFFAEELPPYPGNAIPSLPVPVTPTIIDVGTFLGGATTALGVPQGTTTCRVVFSDSATNWPTIVGTKTGRFYRPDNSGYFAIDLADVGLTANPGAAHDLELFAYLTPVAAVAQLGAGWSMNVVPFETLQSAPFSVGLGAGGTLDLVAAVAGQTVFCLGLNYQVTSAAAADVTLEDDAGVVLARLNTSVAQAGRKHLFGVPATLSHKVRLHNLAAIGAGGLAGELVFTQH